MSGELGRFTAIIGGDGSGLTRTLAGSASRIEGFVKDTQRSFAQIGVGGDFGKAGTKAGKEIVDALRVQLEAGRPLLKQFAANVDVGNTAAVGVVKQLVAEHQRLSAAAGASAEEMQEIANISHTLKGRELGEAAARARTLEENARAAASQLRGIALAIRDAGRSTSGLDAISRRIGEFSEGTGFSSTRTQSLTRLRDIEISLHRALQSTQPTLTQRIQLERELARTSEAIRTATTGTVGALGSAGKSVAGLNIGLTSLSRLFPALGAAAAAHALFGFASRTIDAADAMKDMAERSGASVGALSVLGQVAEKSGASNEALAIGLRNLAKQVTALRSGSKDAAASFASIGLTARDFEGLSIDRIFAKVANAQAKFDDESGKTALAMALFGRSGEALIPTLNALANGGFDRATERARVLGGVMSQDMVRAADEFNEAITDVKTASAGLGRGLLSDVLPPLTGFINSLIETRRRALEAREAIPKPFRTIADEFTAFAVRGPLFAVVFGSEQEEAARTQSFGDRMKEAARRLLGLRTAADVARMATAGLAKDPSLDALLVNTKPDITKPVTRDDEIKQLRDLHNAFSLNAADLVRARALEKDLAKEIASGTLTREQRAKAAGDLREVQDVFIPKIDTRQVDELLKRVRSLVDAYGLAGKSAARQQDIIPRLVSGYDGLNRLLAAQTDQSSATSNELRQQLETLKAFDPVLVGLARRQFKGKDIPEITVKATAQIVEFVKTDTTNIPEPVIKVKGDIVDILGTGAPALQDKLKQFIRDATITFKQLPPVAVRVDPTFDPSNISLEFKNALNAARLAKSDMDLSDAIGDQKAFSKATDASADAQKRLKAVAAELAQIIRNNPALSDAAKAFGIEAINTQVQSAVTHTTTLGDRLQSIASFGRGVLSTADAVGLLGDKARLALTNVGDLVESVGKLSNAIKSGSNGDIFGAAIQSAAAATNIIKSIFGDQGAIDKQNREITRSNTQAIMRLSQDLNGFDSTVRQQLTAANAIRQNPLVSARLADGTTRGFKNVEELDRQLRASGSSLADLKRRAEELGITLTDSTGRITAQGLHDLDIALRFFAEKAVRFTNSFADQSDAAALRRRVLGQQDDQGKILDDGLALFKQFAPGLYAKFFEGIDTSTKEGREEFRRRIKAFVEAFIANVIPLADFGGLDKGTLTAVVTAWLDSMDAMTDATKQAVGAIVNMATGFAVSKRVFDAVRAGASSQTSASISAIIAKPPTPTPIPVTTTGSTGAGQVNNFSFTGPLQIINEAGDTPDVLREKVRRAFMDKARTISPQQVADTQRALPA